MTRRPGPAALPPIPPDRPVLIAGPTASGKSALALRIVQDSGGVIVNADAAQVYDCWRVITARPSPAEEAAVPHRLYGHVRWDQPYSAGHWLREVRVILAQGLRPVITGGTGLYFAALTEGLAELPPIPPDIRTRADAMTLAALRDGLDPETAARIDLQNRARVQRAWEVLTATGHGLAVWQDATPPPDLPTSAAVALLLEPDRDWLEQRIRRRIARMLAEGAVDEAAAMDRHYDPSRPAFRAIGVPELISYHRGMYSLDEACERMAVATRQYAKRQRTWFRARRERWHRLNPQDIAS
ncbi:tRNA (adenosine(37)-N6)-dimethylallyltransferase MiaA [Pontibaca methylaminivorans]|uniref:tRNA (adenosine(37)-N6)-dimethylallyltransferase MiaA n=1 Tax=Pontibaca methylaminivorans TaxID=515897 RepID=UPI002FD881BC